MGFGRGRLFAAIGAYVVLLANALAIAHELGVEHQTCPEHGEVVHARAPGGSIRALPVATVAPAAEEVLGCAGEHGCLVSTDRRPGVDPWASLQGAQLPARCGATLFDPRAPTWPLSVPLLDLAPKNSPPPTAV